MRTFNFKVRNIGEEKYLTYVMGEECELDEDVLDYCEENDVKELLGIIYEEDDDYDYLTYDISKRTSLDDFIKEYVSCEQVLSIIRNVANNLISLKEQAIHLAYVLLNRNFMYIDKETLEIKFICLPIESESSIITEFKGFLRQLLANMKYNVDEDLNYVGKLITYINGDKFTLRDLIGLCEALMEEAGMNYDDVSSIDAEGGVEVVNSSSEDTVSGFMDSLGTGDEPLPEIGDDDEDNEDNEDSETVNAPIDLSKEYDDDSELETAEPEEESKEAAKEESAEETKEEAIAEAKNSDEPAEETTPHKKTKLSIVEDTDAILGINEYEGIATSGILLGGTSSKKSKETDIDVIKQRMQELVGEVPTAKESIAFESGGKKTLDEVDSFMGSKKPQKKKNVVKVNRAAIIQNVEAGIEKEEIEASVEGSENISEDNPTENIMVPVVEDVKEEVPNSTPTSSASVLSKTVPENAVMNSVANVPKAAPYLVRVNTEERIMITKVPFKLGKASRGVDYTIRGNGAVSRQHAIIIEKEDVCYIRDNKSTNHTYVNGKIVEDGVDTMLTHDSLITLGDEDFVFKIR